MKVVTAEAKLQLPIRRSNQKCTHTGVLIYVHMPGHTDQHSQPRSVLTQTAPTALFYSPLCMIMVMLGGNAHPM